MNHTRRNLCPRKRSERFALFQGLFVRTRQDSAIWHLVLCLMCCPYFFLALALKTASGGMEYPSTAPTTFLETRSHLEENEISRRPQKSNNFADVIQTSRKVRGLSSIDCRAGRRRRDARFTQLRRMVHQLSSTSDVYVCIQLGMGRIVDFEKTEFPNICFLAQNGRFSYIRSTKQRFFELQTRFFCIIWL